MASNLDDCQGKIESPTKKLRTASPTISDNNSSPLRHEWSHFTPDKNVFSKKNYTSTIDGTKTSSDDEPTMGSQAEMSAGEENAEKKQPRTMTEQFAGESSGGTSGDSSSSSGCPQGTAVDSSSSGDPRGGTAGDSSSSVGPQGSSQQDDDPDSDLDLGLGDISPTHMPGLMGWLHHQMISGANPRDIISKIFSPDAPLPDDISEFEMWTIVADYIRMIEEPPKRSKLDHINTFDDVLSLIRTRKRIMVVTGAGVSVSCGIPDFRSRDGIYARLAVDFPDLPDPQSMFDIHYFRRDPRPFFKFAKEIYPGQFEPSISHQFIALLQQHGKLLRNYSQNIDTLEQVAGITRVVQCHGSFATATCTRCGLKVTADDIRSDIFAQVVPKCKRCPSDEQAIIKPDIVFFGEGLPNTFYDCLDTDKHSVDLLFVIGSSLKVRPVATIPFPNVVPNHVPQILINREPLTHMRFDVELLGDCDVIISEICRRLGGGWDHICKEPIVPLHETSQWPKHHSHGSKHVHEGSKQHGLDGPNQDHRCPDQQEAQPKQPNDHQENIPTESKRDHDVSKHESLSSESITKESFEEAPTPPEISDYKPGNLNQDHQMKTEGSVPPITKSSPSHDNTLDSHTSTSFIPSDTSEGDSKTQNNSVTSIDKSIQPSHNKPNATKVLDLQADDGDHVKHENRTDSSRYAAKEGDDTTHQRQRRESITEYIEPSSYLYVPPSRYVFHGAEVFDSDADTDLEDDDGEGDKVQRGLQDGDILSEAESGSKTIQIQRDNITVENNEGS